MSIDRHDAFPPDFNTWGCLNTPISTKRFFQALSFGFPFNYRFPKRWFHTFIRQIHIVVSLRDVSLQPQALHLFFGNVVPAKLRFSLDLRKTTCKVYAKQDVYIKSGQCLTRTIF